MPGRRKRCAAAAEWGVPRNSLVAGGFRAGVGRIAGGVHQRPHHARLRRHVQVLTAPGTLALAQGDHHIGGGLGPGVERRLRHRAHRHGWPVAIALQADQAAGGLHGDFRRRRRGKRAVDAERRYRHVHKAGMSRVEIAAIARLDEHIRRREKRRRVVRDHALLAGANAFPIQRILAVERADAARFAPARRLHLEHLRAELGQHAPGDLAPAARHVDDANARERWRGGCRWGPSATLRSPHPAGVG